jgi:tRNA G10  N-methylase Trm11
LISKLGGSYKLAKVIGRSLKEALEEITLPIQPKFNWTISMYNCGRSFYEETYQALFDLLKVKGLGKSKFLRPSFSLGKKSRREFIAVAEILAEDVRSRVLVPKDHSSGIDLLVHGGMLGGLPIFAQTIATADSKGFEERDFERPFQDPTQSVSPRIARMLVNLALSRNSKNLLDPFCGLGTVLQEALVSGVSVVGVDKDQTRINQAKANLRWLYSKYHLSSNLHTNLFAHDAMKISRARMPKVDAIATEPILLPLFKENPNPSESLAMIEKVQRIYERSLSEFASILVEGGDRIALTIPVLVDSSGKRRTFDLKPTIERLGLKVFSSNGRFTENKQAPLPLTSFKKKIVQRNVCVFYLP